MGWQSAEGKQVELYFISRGKKVPRYAGKFIGVVKDFHFRSLFNRIQPVIFAIEPDYFNCIVIRIGEDNIPEKSCGSTTKAHKGSGYSSTSDFLN